MSGTGLVNIGTISESEGDAQQSSHFYYALNVAKGTTYTYSGRYRVGIMLLQFG